MEKNTLYKAYLEEKRKKQKDENTIKKYNLSKDENTIVINQNKNSFVKIISLLVDIFIKILKLVITIGVVILVTIGATVVLNRELLECILNFIGW